MIDDFKDVEFASFTGPVDIYQLVSYLGQKIDCCMLWKVVLVSYKALKELF